MCTRRRHRVSERLPRSPPPILHELASMRVGWPPTALHCVLRHSIDSMGWAPRGQLMDRRQIDPSGVEEPHCSYHFVWRSAHACPLCMKEDFTRVVGECDLKGVQRASYHLRLPRRCNFLPGASVPPDEVLKCGAQLASPSHTLAFPRTLGTPRCGTKSPRWCRDCGN